MVWWMWLVWLIVLTFGFVVFRGAPYVPSRRRYIHEAFSKLYPLTKNDVLIDIGSGDGIVLRLASEFGARAIGYELNPILVIISRFMSRRDKNVSVNLADFWLAPLQTDTNVVYAFIVTRDVKKFVKKMEREVARLGHPLYVVLYGNKLPGRTADKSLGGYRLYTFSPLQIDKP